MTDDAVLDEQVFGISTGGVLMLFRLRPWLCALWEVCQGNSSASTVGEAVER